MLFSSVIFIFLFLPTVLLIYYAVPKKFKNLILFIFSVIFYTWGEWLIVLVMLASTVIDYTCGILIEKGRRKLGIVLSITANLSFLGFFKYMNFTFENFRAVLDFFGLHSQALENVPYIALPIGISFYTFQTMSYTIDVYRGKVKANRNFIEFATFVTMFPQLVAGPIVRYIDISKQLRERVISLSKFGIGVERFIIGLAKKVIIANTFAEIADNIFALNSSDISPEVAWLGVISYTFQIYFDFSGYSDMAIGLGKMFGFDILENFNYPYISRSIKEFWRRWHISLSTWFRDYLYIPLGGSRVSPHRTYINLCIVFFITGLWHGASWNFVIWGLYHGLFLIIERVGFGKVLEKTWRPLSHFYTLLVVIIGWVFFRADDLSHSVSYLKAMFSFNVNESIYTIHEYLNIEVYATGLIAIIISMPIYHLIQAKYRTHITESNLNVSNIAASIMNLSYTIILFGLFYFSVMYLSAGTYNPFIYFRF